MSVTQYERKGRKGWRLQVFLGRDSEGRQAIRSRTYWPDEHDANIKPWSRAGKRLAEEEMRRFRLDLGTATAADAQSMTITELIERWAQSKPATGRKAWSPTTRRNVDMWANRAGQFFGTANLTQITPDRLDGFYRDVKALGASTDPDKQREVSDSTVARCHDVIRGAFSYAEETGWIAQSPVKKRHSIDRDTHQRQVPDAEAIRAAITHAQTGPPMWAIFLRMLTVTAARRGEVLAFRYSDLDGNDLTIRRNIVATKGAIHVKAPKSGSERVVVLSDDSVKRWHRWHAHVAKEMADLGMDMPDDGYLFTAGEDLEKPLHPDSAKNWWARLKKRVPELEGVTMHSLRHYGATTLANDPGLPITAAQAQLGHANLRTTQGYLHEDTDVRRQAGERLSRDFE